MPNPTCPQAEACAAASGLGPPLCPTEQQRRAWAPRLLPKCEHGLRARSSSTRGGPRAAAPRPAGPLSGAGAQDEQQPAAADPPDYPPGVCTRCRRCGACPAAGPTTVARKHSAAARWSRCRCVLPGAAAPHRRSILTCLLKLWWSAASTRTACR